MPQKNNNLFFSSLISPFLLLLYLSTQPAPPRSTISAVSFTHVQVYCPSFVPGHCQMLADFLWIRPRFCATPASVSCQPTFFVCFHSLSYAIQVTVSCWPISLGFAPGIGPSRPLLGQPNMLRWDLNPYLYCNLIRNQRVFRH